MPKLKLFIFVLLCLVATSVSFFVGKVYASNPIPQFKIPCQEQADPNFHSQRPYQAAPCGDAPKAYYCANAVIIYEKVPVHKTVDEPGPYEVNIPMPEKEYAVTISETTLPIYGNTELVKNAVNSSDTLNDPEKLNEYLNWYLNGVNNKAEYGNVTNDQVVNFAGPTQKLLPAVIQEVQRSKIVESASTKHVADVAVEDPEDFGRKATDNHNDVVVCESGGKAVPCPGGNTMRLKDWGTGELSLFNTILNWVGISAWDKKVPPLPWQFDKEILYQKAYNEWRGKQCNIVFGKLLCLDVPGITSNVYADLFQYVPLTNNSDINAKIEVEGVQVDGKGGTEIQISDPTYKIIKEPVNWFPHTGGDFQDIDSLSKLYKPQVCKDGKCAPLEGKVDYNTVESGILNGKCNVLEVRSNPGDQLFTDKSELRLTVAPYTVTQVMCDDPVQPNCSNKKEENDNCPTNEPIKYRCHGEVQIAVRSDLKNPFSTEIYNQSTADSTSIFRKIFPKVQEGAPVSCIADIPGVSKAVYTPTEGTDKLVIHDPGLDANVPSDDAKLYFPHIGSVYEYFLRGIQTALRPQGFGSPIVNGGLCGATKSTCDGTLFSKLGPPSGTTPQAHDYFNSQILSTLTPELFKVYAEAEKATGVPCEILAGVHFEEGDNKPSASLQNGGPLSGSLLASAIQAGNEIKAKVGGKLDSWDKVITALSRYNGGGNSNCGRGVPYTGPCPPPEGIDDPYPTAWIDPRHLTMYLIYCQDFTQCPKPYPLIARPGSLTVATEVFLNEGKNDNRN